MKKTIVISFIAALIAVLMAEPMMFSSNVNAATTSDPTATSESSENESRASRRKVLGSMGYFDSVGDAKATKTILNSKYKNYVKAYKTGASTAQAEVDATSLTNMQAAIKYLKECNRIRANNGLSQLKVTDINMAQAQANADYSDRVINHAGQFRNTAENAAWTWTSSEDPFSGWYTAELKLYKKYCSSGKYKGLSHMSAYQVYKKYPRLYESIGHYLNVTDPSLKTTGFALCTRGSRYKYTYIQVFDSKAPGRTYTVSQYEKKLNSYCSGEAISSSRTASASTSVTVAKPSLRKAGGARKSIKVIWKRVSGATGYQIRYSRNKSMSNAKYIKVSSSSSSRTIKGLKRHAKYNVQVRAYKVVNGSTYHSGWSTKKACTVK